ncbi:MAG: Vms1/Ankzf1 family peptidyl-tRNA hydrolase [Mycobacteriales bacterium]
MADHPTLPSPQGTGPVVSVYLDLAVAATGHGGEIPLRWRALRSVLSQQGAGEDVLHLIDERVRTIEPSPRTLAAFVQEGRLEAEELEDCVAPDAASFGPLPMVVPLLRWRQQWVPYVVALVDRAGADLAAYLGAGAPVAEQVVVGPDDEIERNAPGGWAGLAQGRYQHRAEDSWAHNAAEVSTHLARLVAEVDAKLLLTAGDVRAVQELTEHLPEPLRRLQEHVTTGLEQQAPGRARLQRVTVTSRVRAAAARARAQVLNEVAEAVGGKHHVAGEEQCTEALRRGAVRRLVVVDRPGDERWAWTWSDPLRLAPADVPPAEVPGAVPAPMREALVRAAFAQSADVTVVGPDEVEVQDGLAALVRF